MAVGHHHAQCRAVGDGQCRRIGEADAVGNPDELVGARPAEFGQAAMHRLAHQAAFDPVDRIDQHAVALLPAGDTGAHFGDLAGHIEAHDRRHRHLDAGHAAAGEDVVVVEGRRLDGDDHIAFARRGVGEAGLVDQAVRPAMLTDNCCFHFISLQLGSVGRARACRFCWCRQVASLRRRSRAADAGRPVHWPARRSSRPVRRVRRRVS